MKYILREKRGLGNVVSSRRISYPIYFLPVFDEKFPWVAVAGERHPILIYLPREIYWQQNNARHVHLITLKRKWLKRLDRKGPKRGD